MPSTKHMTLYLVLSTYIDSNATQLEFKFWLKYIQAL